MNRILYRFAAFVFILTTNQVVSAQDTYNYTQFFVNPSLINPAYTGIDGQPAAFLSFRKQWMGFVGAPTIGSLSVQAPLPTRLSVGLNFANDSRGLLKTSSFLFSNSYYIPTAPKTYLRFGFSLGAAWNKVDVNALNFGSIGDAVLADLLSSNFTLIGNAGLAFQAKAFQIGASIPNIFQPAYLSKDAFTVSKVKPFESVILQTSYRVYFSRNKMAFEPTLLYRYNNSMPSQLEVGGVLHMNNVAWVGGSFKQHFGISAMLGLKPSHLSALGYSYTMKNIGINELNSPTHEVQLAILFGVRNKKIPMYSFVNVEKEKGSKDPTHERQKYYAQKGNKGNQATASNKPKGKTTPPPTGGPRGKTSDPLSNPATGGPRGKTSDPLSNTGNTQSNQTKTNPTTGNTQQNQVATNTTTGNTQNNQTKTNPTTNPQVKTDPNTPVVLTEEEQRAQEEDVLNRLEEHADNPTETHDEEPTHAERHEFYKRGDHASEMDLGDYVIVGVFKSEANAKRVSDGYRNLGFSEVDYGFQSGKNLWFVHIAGSDDIEEARTMRNKYRKMKMFKDAWLLTVHQ